MSLARQFRNFFGVGLVSAVAHYAALVALVQGGVAAPVPAALAGYVAGGFVSYILTRAHVFESDRPHHEAAWRFIVVAGVGFGLTWLIMHALVDRAALPYLLAQVLTTGVVLFWSFLAHRIWTFGARL